MFLKKNCRVQTARGEHTYLYTEQYINYIHTRTIASSRSADAPYSRDKYTSMSLWRGESRRRQLTGVLRYLDQVFTISDS